LLAKKAWTILFLLIDVLINFIIYKFNLEEQRGRYKPEISLNNKIPQRLKKITKCKLINSNIKNIIYRRTDTNTYINWNNNNKNNRHNNKVEIIISIIIK